MTAMVRKGWCPSLLKPMESGDGWLARVPVANGILPVASAAAIAGLARRFGNGAIDLTQRGNLQLRGLSPATHKSLVAALSELGLASEPPVTVLTSPLAGLDPDCDPATLQIADAIRSVFTANPVPLPAKFLIVVDGGGAAPVGLPADLYFPAPFDRDASLAAVHDWLASPPTSRRAVSATTGRTSLGLLPLGDLAVAAIQPPFGRMDWQNLADLAALCQRFGAREIRLSPGRILFVPLEKADFANAFLSAAHDAGFLIDDGDPRRNVATCPGAPACASALGDTRNLALQLSVASPGIAAHVSGCAKGCACPRPAPYVLTARGDGYDVGRNGRAGTADIAQNISAAAAIESLKIRKAGP